MVVSIKKFLHWDRNVVFLIASKKINLQLCSLGAKKKQIEKKKIIRLKTREGNLSKR